MLLERLPSDRYVTFGCWSNLLVVRSHVAESRETFALYEANVRTVLRRHPRGVGLVLLVDHGEPPPEGYGDRVKDLLDRYRAQVLCACAVLTAQGFAAAVQRATASAILSIAGMRGRLAIHQSIDEAVPWLAERMAPPEDRETRSQSIRRALKEKV